MKPQAFTAPWKKDTVKELAHRLQTEHIVGVVNMQDLPAAQLQVISKSLRGKIELYMTKKRLMRRALEIAKQAKPGVEQLEKYFDGMPALLFTRENPFSLYKTLKKNKSQAPAKAGQKAPKDIVIQKGPTPFAPGPVISELSALGLKPGVENGKVAVKEDKVVCKEGEVIKANLASMMLRLGILPMEIGLNLVAVFESGVLYDKKVLDVDEGQFIASIETAAREAVNLAMDISFPTTDTTDMLLAVAHAEAKALAIEAGILAPEVVPDVLAKAEAQATAVKNEANL